MEKFYNYNINQTLLKLKSRKTGLSEAEVSLREKANSENEYVKKNNIAMKFISQFFDLMVIILLLSSATSIIIGIVRHTTGEIVDGCLILAIVIMNAIFGVVQEYKAEKSLEALAKLTSPECFVVRDGNIKKINVKDLVVGDVVSLEAGSIVPADLRLIETHAFQVDESSLTGESNARAKDCDVILPENTPLAERRNIAFAGSSVSCGRALGVVIALGSDTELGSISKAIKETTKSLTPLQKSIKDMGKILTILVLVIAVVTFVIEMIVSPLNIMDAFLTSVAISVAAIPESMPAVITIIMSLGVARLAKQKAIVKRLHSVETLGCCDVICSDKTGTITQNKMTVKSVFCDLKFDQTNFSSSLAGKGLVTCGLLNNDCFYSEGKLLGDPTEKALVVLGEKTKINYQKTRDENKRLSEIPFDSNRKLMSVLCQTKNGNVMFCKGAFDRLLDKCDKILIDGKILPLNENCKNQIVSANSKMTQRAERVLGFAVKQVSSQNDFVEKSLIFVGLVGMIDPPRKEIKEAVKKCKSAGMKPVMITGDYPQTAFAIAKEIGIAKDLSQVITGSELEKMSPQELEKTIDSFTVFARVSPQDKMKIVGAFKKRGHIVAMTGDGVNDAPSLKSANIGIGMGQSGTDVAKEVSDLIIADDNFATIVLAVEEGRKIYANIQKTVKFLFSANLAELLSLFIITLLYPSYVFLFPVQILFVNLITDSLPAIALGLEEPEKDLMSCPPRTAKQGLFSNGNGVSIIVLGLIQTLLVVISYAVGIKFYDDKIATTMGFYTLNIIQMFYLASMRTGTNFFKSKPFKNKFFLLAVFFCFALTSLFAFSPLRNILKLASLTGGQWLIIFLLCMAMFLISEIYKFAEKRIVRKINQKKQRNKQNF